MEEQISYKVYTYWGDNDKPEVRRFGVDKSVRTSYHYLNAKLQDVFPRLKNKFYTISWKDEEGDDVVISSDEELVIALQSFGEQGLIKLYVDGKHSGNINDDPHVTISGIPDCGQVIFGTPLHLGIICDGCDGPVVGFRYKCTSCDDFDLCSTCEASKQHPEHCMVRIPEPNLPSAVIRHATKRYRHFLKTVVTSFDEGHCKKRRDRSQERKRRDHGHGHGHGHVHRPHGGDGDHHRRPRTSWLETFGNYMNEFANLAGDVNIETENSQPQQQAQTQEQPNETQPPVEGARMSCPFNMERLDVQNMQKLLKMYVGGLNTSTPCKPSSSNNPEPSNVQPEQAASDNKNEDVEMADSEVRNSEADQGSVTSEGSTSTIGENKKDESPEKGDDWTVINKENDIMDTANASGSERPIGFNLPKEFQDRMNISQGQSIYPPLNAATAVLNPKEAEPPVSEQRKPAPTADNSKPSAPPSGQEKPQPEAQPKPKTRKHPLAHIEAAIEQMIAMGFTNEGGWVTQLLESKDGNIAAVLDLLTPVNPKKQ